MDIKSQPHEGSDSIQEWDYKRPVGKCFADAELSAFDNLNLHGGIVGILAQLKRNTNNLSRLTQVILLLALVKCC